MFSTKFILIFYYLYYYYNVLPTAHKMFQYLDVDTFGDVLQKSMNLQSPLEIPTVDIDQQKQFWIFFE